VGTPFPGVDAGPPVPQSGPERDPAVGWYPSAPAAGPYAAPAATGRGVGPRLTGRLPGRSSGPAWRGGRGRLANVLVFGLGPLVLAGVIVAAFVLVSPGKGSAASRTGFQAGHGASAPQPTVSIPTASASSSPAPAPRAKHHGSRATPSPTKLPAGVKTAKPKTKTKPKPTPKPRHRSGGGRVVPHNLGVPDFTGYCQHIGARTAELTASNAYGWHCALNPNQVLQVINVCAWTYHLSTSQVVSVSTNFYDPNAWQCWRINRDLGVLNFSTYCVAAGLGSSKLIASNAYGWRCTGSSAPIDTTAACGTVYHVSDVISRFAVFADPYSWQCWG
jgi:Rieske Fe-S protein